MSDLLHEQLSALIDGELPAHETALLLKRLHGEPALRERLGRYRVCGETLRGGQVQAREDFALKVSALLVAEPCHAGRPRVQGRPARRYLRPVAGFAVAAAVAGAAILVLGRPGGLAGAPQNLAAQATVVAPAPTEIISPPEPVVARLAAKRTTPSAAFETLSPEPSSYVTPAARQGLAVIPRAELANYLVVHSEVSGPLGLTSALSGRVSDDTGSVMAPAR
jgi:hypothetical protein